MIKKQVYVIIFSINYDSFLSFDKRKSISKFKYKFL